MKTLPIAIAFGLFGAVAVSISLTLKWPTWVMFIAWVSFYIFGRTIESSLKAFMQITLGIVLGLMIQLSAGYLTALLGPLGFPMAVFIHIGSLAYFGRTKTFGNIPAWFLGLIVLFGSHPTLQAQNVLELFIPLIAGFLFAWLNNATVEKINYYQN